MGVLYAELSDIEETYMLPFLVKEGFSIKKCAVCGQYKLRKDTGRYSRNRKRKYWADEKGAIWRGSKCPPCSVKAETRHRKSRP